MTVRKGFDAYWLIALPGVGPLDRKGNAADIKSIIKGLIADAPQPVQDGLDELLTAQRPYAPSWHTFKRKTGFVVIAPIVDEANQRASDNVLALMIYMLRRGATLITPMPLSETEARDQFGDIKK